MSGSTGRRDHDAAYENAPPTAGTGGGGTGASAPPSPPAERTPDGELVLRVAGQLIGSWKSVNVSASVEAIPRRFDVRASAKNPGEMRDLVPLNSKAEVLIGGHVVLTGYLEQLVPTLSAEEHGMRYAGRGRCCDLVDCAAVLGNQTRINVPLGQLADLLVKPFEGPIKVLRPDGDGAKPYPFITVNQGETVYEMIERIARFEGFLVYEDADGNLVVGRVGKDKHASGFATGQNIQAVEFVGDMSQRFSVYKPIRFSTDTLSRPGSEGGNAAGDDVPDPLVKRYRPRIIVSEQWTGDDLLAHQRAVWEAQRRLGRSFRAEIVADSWLDSAGVPWTPNKRARIEVPELGVDKTWIITDVVFRRDERSGTTAQVTLMPPEALTVEPVGIDSLGARAADNANPPASSTPSPASPSAPNALPNRDGRRDEGGYSNAAPANNGRRDRGDGL